MMNRLFKLQENSTKFRKELAAGTTIFGAVADKLGVTVEQLCDIDFMRDFRADHGLGVCMPEADEDMCNEVLVYKTFCEAVK